MSLDAQALEQMKHAIQKGYAVTPTFHDQPSKEERDSQISIIARVLTAQYNTNPTKPILHWKSIYLRVMEIIGNEKALGNWPYKIPEIESVRRSINYSADKRRFPDEEPPAICTTPGFYCFNPSRLQDEVTKRKLIEIIEAFEK